MDAARPRLFTRPDAFDLSPNQSVLSAVDKGFWRAYCVFAFEYGGFNIMAHFELQPAESELQQLAEQYWQKAGDREQQLEKAAFEAGTAIRNGDYSLGNLEAIVRWKSERVVHYLIGNSEAQIRKVLAVAASPESSVRQAVEALMELRGIDLPIASAILAAIAPDRYNVLDFRALEALGNARHNVEFYTEFVAFCRRMAEQGMLKPQEGLPGPTALHALDRALWEWSRSQVDQGVAV
jgi:hypothetical protein